MRLILLILLLCSFGADAQMIIKAHANYRPYAQPAANLLLDDYPNAAAAYSLRKLDKDYSGSAIRVRRSNDNAEQDIGFTSSGFLDTVSLKTFVGANNGFVTTWYDQSGNSRNATQSTAANQPRIINAGVIDRENGKITLLIDELGDQLVINYNISTPFFLTSVHKYLQTNNTTSLIGNLQNSGNFDGFLHATSLDGVNNTRSAIRTGGVAYLTNTTTVNNLFLLTSYFSTTSLTSYANGTLQNTVTATYNLRDNVITIGAGRTGEDNSFRRRHNTSEVIFWASDQSSNRTGIENNINDYYNIYWNGDFTGILDTYPNSAAAYSLRNLSSTYKGPLIRVRRSNDNAEQDIFGDYYGNLDTVGLKSFVGANNAFVTTWYDQSGNSRNATQGTAANQPRIVNAGVVERDGNIVCIVNDGTNDRLTSTFTLSQPFHVFLAANPPTSENEGTAFRVLFSARQNSPSDAGLEFYTNTTLTQKTFMYSGAILGDNTIRTAKVIASVLANGNSSHYYYNNNLIASGNGGTNTINDIRLGSNWVNPPDNIRYYNTKYHEIIIYNSNQSTNRTGIQTNINTYYSIY